MSIRYKILILLVVVSMVSSSLIAWIAIGYSKRLIIDQISRSSLDISQLAMQRINEFLYERFHVIVNLSQSDQMNNFMAGGEVEMFLLSGHIKDIFSQYDEYFYMMVVDKNGKVVAANDDKYVGMDLSGVGAVQDALKGQDVLNDVEYDKIVQEYSMVMASPVRENSDWSDISGVLFSALRWDLVSNMNINLKVRGKQQDEANHMMITYKTGMVISCFDSEEMFNDNLIAIGGKAALHAQEGKEGFIIEQSEHYVSSFSTYTFFKPYRTLPHLGWLVVFLQDPREIFAPLVNLQWAIVKVMGGVFLFLILISFIFSSRISGPILKVALAAQAFGKGELDKDIMVESKDEVGFLVYAFNDMAGKIRNWRRELEKEVQARTAALEFSNKELNIFKTDLEIKVKERTSEIIKASKILNEKIVELESFQKVVIGREQRIIELKDEIAKLQGQLKLKG